MTYEPVPPGAIGEGDVVQASHYLQLEPVPHAPGQARSFVRSHAPDLPQETVESLLLLTSELVTNAVLHARTTIRVGVVVGQEWIAVGVHDLDLMTGLQEPYADREGGWGHSLVSALAHSWSTTRYPGGGKTVWFRLRRGDAHVVADGAAARADADRRDA
ncbi:MAG: Serine phosphatase RsbU, regulator of sigma subunit [uncultured Nocardioidaceae bacterium]|uniref:Serine phosphatase RsbU, regulator of sigma subunit n=1 Tax=uncultured Nocardioidaceae bacterium TaxID=253824 RepID=A0A6J4MCL1_9ACTN|nr:MAG: Serine phosphatase RsbU, regulator of sigma subunit [uncultured Nocardioidaceae bacterium]